MFPVQITISNAAQLNAVMAALNVEQVIATEAKATAANFAASPAEDMANAEKTKKAKATVATNGASSTPEPTSVPAEAAAQQPAPEAARTAEGAASVSYEDVKKAIIKLSQGKGRDAVVALLGEFNAEAGPQLKPEQYAAFVTKAEARAGA
jgi:hypothetical protein